MLYHIKNSRCPLHNKSWSDLKSHNKLFFTFSFTKIDILHKYQSSSKTSSKVSSGIVRKASFSKAFFTESVFLNKYSDAYLTLEGPSFVVKK